jgi:hypothetical protein
LVQKRFQQSLARHDKLSVRLLKLQQTHDEQFKRRNGELPGLILRRDAAQHVLVRLLDEHFRGKSLNARERYTASKMIARIAGPYAADGNAEMLGLHDAHSDQTLADIAKEQMEFAREAITREYGDVFIDGEVFENVRELMDAAAERLREEQLGMLNAELARREARAEKRAEKRAQKQAARKKAKEGDEKGDEKSTDAVAQPNVEQDADAMLRTVYRRLAKLLHPDLEPEEAERARKTELMSQANAAYAKRDILALMRLNAQLDGEMSESKLAQLADDRLQALTLLMDAQNRDLQRELDVLGNRCADEFSTPPEMPPDPELIAGWVSYQLQETRSQAEYIESEVARMNELTFVKAWLKDRRKDLKERGLL